MIRRGTYRPTHPKLTPTIMCWISTSQPAPGSLGSIKSSSILKPVSDSLRAEAPHGCLISSLMGSSEQCCVDCDESHFAEEDTEVLQVSQVIGSPGSSQLLSRSLPQVGLGDDSVGEVFAVGTWV